MIDTLYPMFRYWSRTGSIYLFSDPHFDDDDCKYMNPDWISPEEQIEILNSTVTKNDYLILLGDIGKEEWLRKIKTDHIILLTGNHDKGATIYRKYCEDVFEGPLFIADRILLSHEPIYGLENMCVNIHGHCHASDYGIFGMYGHVNLAADVCNYEPYSLKELIKTHNILSGVENYHRATIDKATADKILRKTEY